MNQDCVSCGQTVCKFKDGVEWKIYKAHRALDEDGSVDSRVPVICDECFDQGEGNIKFKDAKHYNENGTWIGPKHRMIAHAKHEIESAKKNLISKEKELEKIK